MDDALKLDGLVPERLAPKTHKVVLDDYCVTADIGFHEFEVGRPQRLMITVEVWLDEAFFPHSDAVEEAWDYDFLRSEIGTLATSRRWNLQETLAREIYDRVSARFGVTALRVSLRKPDIYPDCAGVGVELASF